MVWPVVYEKYLKLGNKDSSVCICTLWSNPDTIISNIPKDRFAIAGNLYTIHGINYLIRNILANPKIRYIILCGKDPNGSGEALVNFMKKGIMKNRRIYRSNGFVDSNIPMELIEKLRKKVELFDMRGKEKDIPELINKLPDKEPFIEPVFIEKEDSPTAFLYTEEVGFDIKEDTIKNTWLKSLDMILKFGDLTQNKKEILNIMMVIEKDDTNNEWLKLVPKIKKEFLSENEINETAEELGKRMAFSRDVKSDELIQFFWNIKDKKIHQTCIFKQIDVFEEMPNFAYSFREIQSKIAEKMKAKNGNLIIISNQAFVKNNDLPKVDRILNNMWRGGKVRFIEDKRGYFVVSVEDDEIIVQHHLPDGRKSPFTFRGKDINSLYRWVLHENLITKMDHAAYIGKEVTRAKLAILENKEYIQDEA